MALYSLADSPRLAASQITNAEVEILSEPEGEVISCFSPLLTLMPRLCGSSLRL